MSICRTGSRWAARSVTASVGCFENHHGVHPGDQEMNVISLPTVPTDPDAVPLTVTHLLEHLYCPRFTYFEYVLGIPEQQEKRTLVQKGRAVHEERRHTNPNYLRKKLGV